MSSKGWKTGAVEGEKEKLFLRIFTVGKKRRFGVFSDVFEENKLIFEERRAE